MLIHVKCLEQCLTQREVLSNASGYDSVPRHRGVSNWVVCISFPALFLCLFFVFLALAAQILDPGLQHLLLYLLIERTGLWQADPEGETDQPFLGWRTLKKSGEGNWGESKVEDDGILVTRNQGFCEQWGGTLIPSGNISESGNNMDHLSSPVLATLYVYLI